MELEHTAGNPFIKQAFEVKIKGIPWYLYYFLFIYLFFILCSETLLVRTHTKKGNKKSYVAEF